MRPLYVGSAVRLTLQLFPSAAIAQSPALSDILPVILVFEIEANK